MITITITLETAQQPNIKPWGGLRSSGVGKNSKKKLQIIKKIA